VKAPTSGKTRLPDSWGGALWATGSAVRYLVDGISRLWTQPGRPGGRPRAKAWALKQARLGGAHFYA
jgi:hypothetical protein